MAGCAQLVVRLGRGMFWIIVVSLFLIFVIALFQPVTFCGTSSEVVRVKSTMKDLQVSTGYFKMEYACYPVSSSETQLLRTEGALLLSLLGQDKESNPRGIKFIDLPIARGGKYGLTGVKEKDKTIPSTTTLTDLWGEKYYLLIDADGDNRIPNPELRPDAIFKGRGKDRAPEFLNSSTIIFSSGPDRDPKTWDDNICSWR